MLTKKCAGILTLICCSFLTILYASETIPKHLRGKGPEVGKPAPDFTLKTKDGEKKIKLSSLYGKKPVVLVFASFT